MEAETKNHPLKETRGGARPGAGRKPNQNKKIKMTVALAPDVVNILRNTSMPIAHHIENAVREYDAGDEFYN